MRAASIRNGSHGPSHGESTVYSLMPVTGARLMAAVRQSSGTRSPALDKHFCNQSFTM